MSVLVGVAQQQQAARREQLERFALQYTQPLVLFLVRAKAIALEDAEEIVQDFWLAKLIMPPPDQTIAAKYLATMQDRVTTSSGAFRRYLMRSVSHHFIDRLRRRKNMPISLDAMEGFDAASEQDCQQFDAAWANAIFRACVNEVRAECLSNNQRDMWQLFCLQIVLPKLRGSTTPGYASLAARFHFDEARSAANAVRTVIRKFQKRLKSRINDYLPVSPTEERAERVEQEYIDLVTLLSQPGTLDLALFDDILAEFPDQDSLTSSTHSSNLSSTGDGSQLLPDPSQTFYADVIDLEFRWQQILQTSLSKWLSDNGEPASLLPNITFNELIAGSDVPMEGLLVLRNTAKRLAREESEEPSVMLAGIYLIAIISGVNNHSRLLTGDSLEKVAQRIEHLLRSQWLDAGTRQLFNDFRAKVSSGQ